MKERQAVKFADIKCGGPFLEGVHEKTLLLREREMAFIIWKQIKARQRRGYSDRLSENLLRAYLRTFP
jgi:hypothetical protein